MERCDCDLATIGVIRVKLRQKEQMTKDYLVVVARPHT